MGNKVVDENRPGVPVFGFRTGKSWKMIIAVLYYALAGFILVTSIINEFRYYSFEAVDVVLVIIKYVFIFVFLFSPLIFLSDFKYTYNIPLFRRKERTTTIIGMIIVLSICYLMMQLNIYVGSDLYKNSVKEYTLKNTALAIAPFDKKMESDELKIVLGKIDFAKAYTVQVATDSSFKTPLITKDFKKSQFTIKSPKLKNQKKLLVRAMCYGTVNKKTVKGEWSDIKRVKFKKTKKSKSKNNKVETTKEMTSNKETKKDKK